MEIINALHSKQHLSIKNQFLLDPTIIFLNHGSFGATPIPVFENYQYWQHRLETQPVSFLARELSPLLRESRIQLAKYLNTKPGNLVYVQNATHGLNILARSMNLGPDDEVLTTNHEYGASDRIWKFLSNKKGFEYRPHSIKLPLSTDDQFVNDFFSDVSPKTRVIFLSHISSPTALIFPIAAICKKARELGILTIIDGAHGPGQLMINLDEFVADFYVGNLHKWLCAPKGSAFLFACPEVQHLVEPLIISWGWEAEFPGESRFQDYLEWSGTQDFSSYLAVPAAITFQESNQWEVVRKRCHALAKKISELLNQTFPNEPPLFENDHWFAQMVSIPITSNIDPLIVKNRLYEEYKIEVPVHSWNNKTLIRVSVQAYNTWEELEILHNALKVIYSV